MMSYSTFAYATKDFTSAERWLSKGRNKKDRPLYYSGLRLRSGSSTDELVVFHTWFQMDIAKLYRDGTVVVHAPMYTNWRGSQYPSLRSFNVRRLVAHLAGFEKVFQRNWKHYIIEDDPVRTPSKLRSCKACSGTGKRDGFCWAATYTAPCEHGAHISHRTKASENCYHCSGTGRRDYGNRPLKIEWDGSPIRVLNGKLVKKKPTLLEMSIANHVTPSS